MEYGAAFRLLHLMTMSCKMTLCAKLLFTILWRSQIRGHRFSVNFLRESFAIVICKCAVDGINYLSLAFFFPNFKHYDTFTSIFYMEEMSKSEKYFRCISLLKKPDHVVCCLSSYLEGSYHVNCFFKMEDILKIDIFGSQF